MVVCSASTAARMSAGSLLCRDDSSRALALANSESTTVCACEQAVTPAAAVVGGAADPGADGVTCAKTAACMTKLEINAAKTVGMRVIAVLHVRGRQILRRLLPSTRLVIPGPSRPGNLG